MAAGAEGPHDIPAETPALTQRRPRREVPAWLNGLVAVVALYLFLAAIDIMGAGLKDLGKNTDFIENLLAHAHNPFVALMGSVLVTAIVQSSSFTTSLIITLVAAGQMQMADAVYAVMGANIGTSVTGVIVALGNIRIRRQFRRAFSAALVHDIFNWLTVLVLFPIEWISSAFHSERHGLLLRLTTALADLMGLEPGSKPYNPLKEATEPMVALVKGGVGWLGASPIVSGSIIAVAGLLLLFSMLALMVMNLRGALLSRIEGLFRRVFFRNDALAYVVGTVATIMVQSSSITTSLIVPLAGAGVVKFKRVFAFILGANLGTTITGLMASVATDDLSLAVPVALSHVCFNLIGTVIWYPLRGVPMGAARWYADLAATSKKYAFLFLIVVFIVLPLVGLLITELLV